jgi:SEC-C motif-containing protein
MKNCYCSSEKNFEECCEPFLLGKAKPLTAEELMRSRYSAFATANLEYIMQTIQSAKRKHYIPEAILDWAKSSTWQKLEIVSTQKGMAKDFNGMVEFKAFYINSEGKAEVHHERSIFVKELGKWFFVDGETIE